MQEEGGPFQLPETVFYTTRGPHFQRSGSNQAQGGADDTGGVKLEWLENPVVLATDGRETPQVQDASGTLGSVAQPADAPDQPDVFSVNDEMSQVPVRPLWLQDYVRTVVVYPSWPFTLVGTVAY